MSLDACAALVQRGDPDRFAALLAAPVAARARLLPLYALNLEVARAPWVSKEPMIAEMRLQWWRDVVAEPTTPRAHEVAAPLHALIVEASLPRDVLDRMIEARRWDIYRDPFEDQAAMDAYLEDTAAGLMWSSARALGAGPGAEAAVRAYGWAAGLAAYLRAIPDLAARGRIPLLDGRPEAVAQLALRGLIRLNAARHAGVPRALRPALLPGWQAEGLLKQAARDPAAVAEGQLILSDFARRGRLLWQATTGLF
ncbi:MAG: squalene/phytoene synthase family protein [Pseudotabrizicola sp.]|uniref:squalene/phytoene synthase family protein n=1 Tax=Pseudotabrizicola sp. TaxID=2939647 RepID=UPI002719493D|nr:squalene/phytoene synthase family protein [Pseudotabrizicola sp.]MDO8884496.1 squalene/phytoene synthase family protein [Pseudotabrizicola sp.]MDP2082692.1 squalene/phytoene synthase family protein [Pseudotabrizicola sp.]MDZ7573588.1 squalene/phytoene synthase family protein [Pseudotabrizicola sp.]